MLASVSGGAGPLNFDERLRMYEPARRLLLALSFTVATLATLDLGLVSAAQAQPSIGSESKYAAIVMDASTGEVLYAKNADAIRYPASITKIMTLYLTFEALSTGHLRLDDTLTVSAHATHVIPSKLGLRPGQTISVDEAMRAVAVMSANDMAIVLAERIGGSESRFATLMTLRAQELGMTNTHYVNANGLPDPRQQSSAHDIAVLSRAVMRDYPQYYGYFSLHQFAYRGEVTSNHNHLLDKVPGVDGLKTGFINASGYNLAASAVRNNRRLIAVVLGGHSRSARDNHVEALLDAGFEVLARRQAGEQLTFAQNLFPAEPASPVVRLLTSETPADQSGAKASLGSVQLSSLTSAELASLRAAGPAAKPAVAQAVGDPPGEGDATVKLIRVTANVSDSGAARRPAKETSRIEAGAHKGAGDWYVQVGTFKKKAQARAQLAVLKRRYSEQFRVAKADVEGAGRGSYHARLMGLSGSAAKHACAVLSAHHHACTVYEPNA